MASPIVQDAITDSWPTMRAAACVRRPRSTSESFLLVLSGMEPDAQWIVRAALADVLGTLGTQAAADRARSMLRDEDRRVVPSVLNAFVRT